MILTSDIQFQERLKRWARYLVIVALLISLLVLTGWQFDIDFFIHPIPKTPAMNPATAVAFVLFSISFFLLTGKNNLRQKQAGKALACIVACIGVVKLSDLLPGCDLKVDSLLFPVKIFTNSVDLIHARMSPITAFCFVPAGCSLLLLNFETRRKRMPSHYLALIVVVIGLSSFLGYIFTVKPFYGILVYVPMAIHTSINLLFISLAILFATPDRGVMKELTKPFAGSIVARRLIPIAVLIPVTLGLIRLYMQMNRILTDELGITILIICIIISLIGFVVYSMGLLNRRDLENKKSGEKIKDSEQMFSSLFYKSPVMKSISDEQTGRYLDVNDSFAAFFELDKKEIIGKTSVELNLLVHPEEREEILKKLRQDGFLRNIETQTKFRNGKTGWVSTNIDKINLDGKNCFITALTDITEQKLTEEKLLKLSQSLEQKVLERTEELAMKEQRFRKLLENNYEAISLSDEKFIPFYRSPSADRITGWTTEERIKQGGAMVETHPDDIKLLHNAMQQSLASPARTIRITFRTRHKDGHYMWMEGFITNMLHDVSLKGIVTNFRDVTERKLYEQKIEQSEQKYRKLLENNYEVISLSDENFIPFYRSPASERITGRSNEEREKLGLGMVLAHPDDIENLKKTMKEVSENHGKNVPVSFRQKHEDGHYIWFEGFLTNMLHDPSVNAIVANYRDVTERKQAEEEINKLTGELRQLLKHIQTSREEERKHVAREIHDELGQRLTALKIDAGLLQRKMTANGEQNHFDEINFFISQIDQSIESVKRIATDLRPEILDHHGVIEAVKWQADKFENITGVKCKVSYLPDDIKLESELSIAVYRTVQEALTNIARHAKATAVSIMVELNEQNLFVEIKDNGKGIDEKQIKGKKSLGLIGMRERVRILNGILTITGKQGYGTIVSVNIPI